MSTDPDNFASSTRSLGIAVTRLSIVQTWRKLQEPCGDILGLSPSAAAEALGSDTATMRNWELAYRQDGLEGLAY
jgi:hypothetical protein